MQILGLWVTGHQRGLGFTVHSTLNSDSRPDNRSWVLFDEHFNKGGIVIKVYIFNKDLSKHC